MYYLQSRYYDPEVGRFVNADDLVSTDTENAIGAYMFAYCKNNPVMLKDESGNLPEWATDLLIGVAVIAVVAVVAVATAGTGTVLACAAAGALEGAVTGAVSGAITGAATGAITHRMTTGTWEGSGTAALKGAASGFKSGAIIGAVTGALTSPYCFIAGTAVITAAGTVAIENIAVGDKVYAWNEETGQTELKTVVETYENETTELTHVFAGVEEIVTTPSHPFYSPVKGWTAACKLRAGDILVTVNGEYVVVEQVQHELLENPVKVYNFQVEDDHTYYVSGTGVLVHNACGDTGTYSELRAANKGSGNEVHHIIEKRFLNGNPSLGSANSMPSVVVSKAEHQVFTNAWRSILKYGKTYSIDEIADGARIVYANNPKLLEIALASLK